MGDFRDNFSPPERERWLELGGTLPARLKEFVPDWAPVAGIAEILRNDDQAQKLGGDPNRRYYPELERYVEQEPGEAKTESGMSWEFEDEPTQADVDDAIIEDTVHCDFCGASWTLGGHEDGICINLPSSYTVVEQIETRVGGQLKLCIDCALFVSLTLKQNLEERDICEHGVVCGDWCEPCNRSYKEARERQP